MSRRSRSSEPGTDSDGSGQRYAHRVRRRNGSSGSEPTSAAGPVAEHEDMSLFFSPAGSPQEAARIVPAQPLPPPPAVVAPPPPPPPGVVAPPPPPPAEFAPPPPPPAGVQPPAHPPVVPDNDKDVVIAGVRAGISKHEPEALVHMSVRRHRGRDTLGFDMRRTRNQRQLQQEISNNERKSIKSRVLGRIRVEIQEWQRQINPGLNVAGIWEWDRDRDRAILWCHLKAHAESAEHSVSIQIVDGEDD